MHKSLNLQKEKLHSRYRVGNDFFEMSMKKPEMAGPNRALQGYLVNKGVVLFLFE